MTNDGEKKKGRGKSSKLEIPKLEGMTNDE